MSQTSRLRYALAETGHAEENLQKMRSVKTTVPERFQEITPEKLAENCIYEILKLAGKAAEGFLKQTKDNGLNDENKKLFSDYIHQYLELSVVWHDQGKIRDASKDFQPDGNRMFVFNDLEFTYCVKEGGRLYMQFSENKKEHNVAKANAYYRKLIK